MKVKCPKCNYEWQTNSKLLCITCPNCQLKSNFTDKVQNETKSTEKKKHTL